MALGHVSLGDLLSGLVRDRARQHPDATFSFRAEGLAASYGDSIDLTVYRCIQEGLTNAIRHAVARNIDVALEELHQAGRTADANALLLTLRDDGRGIDPDTPLGYGLQGMQERVQALGGSCMIEGGPDRGTSVRIVIPVHKREALRDNAASGAQ
jgi:two-component system sensor histidine kinase UhpB